jgi:hypothetical protein
MAAAAAAARVGVGIGTCTMTIPAFQRFLKCHCLPAVTFVMVDGGIN